MDTSVIMTTYNKPRHLTLALEGYLYQTDLAFELVVTDDGSGPETAEVVAAFRSRAPFPVIHARREHQGFRRAAVLNLGIRSSTTGYCVFTDGDCIPAKDFVEIHRTRRGCGCFLLGGYLRLAREYSESLTPELIAAGDFVRQMTRKRRIELWRRHLGAFFAQTAGVKDRPRIAGANFSAWRCDLDAVNGYDENLAGWGREDSDIRTRFRYFGLRGRSAWTRCLVYHIYHEVDPSKAGVRANIDYYYRTRGRTRCDNGLVKEQPQ